jgi:hypothetical protein
MLSGFILGLVILLVYFMNMYHKSVTTAVIKMNQVVANTLSMKQSIDDIDSVMNRVINLLPKNYSEKSHKELLLFALDDIKTLFKGGEITITGFEEKAGELLLAINIKTPVTNYKNVVKDVEYLQNLRFPSFHIKAMVIEKTADKQKDDLLICKIEGALKIPAGKLKGNI